MAKQTCIITITDGISPTSMPFNEFVLYRFQNYPEEKQIIIQVFEKSVERNITIPCGVGFYSLGMNPWALLKKIFFLEQEYNVKVYHIHEGKSVILFSVASFFFLRKKVIYTLHSTFKNYPFHNKLFSFCASILAKKVVCVSKTSYKYYPTILKRLRGNNVMAIQNGVDIERIEAAGKAFDIKDRPFTMVYVARLVPLKRHYILFEALKHLPHVHLDLIGQGSLLEDLQHKAKDLGIEHQVCFKGLLPREEVYRQLKSADLYVSTSSYEGLPIGVLEAMACEAPCLVTDIDQHMEILEKCPSLMALPTDIKLWVDKIRELSKMDKPTLKQIGKLNRDYVKKYFSLESMHQQYNKLYYKK